MSDRRVTSLNHRLRNAAEAAGVAPERLRNRMVFQRVLARLATDDRWVLKGGFALEVRLGLTARATKDLDLLRWGTASPDALELQDLLDEALEADLGDGFSFGVRTPRQLRIEDAQPSTWRVVVDAFAHATKFAEVTIDIVTRDRQPAADLETLKLAPVLDEGPVSMAAVDVHRQAAEKFHAYARVYAHERPSSRVKDLVDLALLHEATLLDPASLGVAIRQVFAERDGGPPPAQLPPPPGDWELPFRRLAGETGLQVTSSDAAWRLLDTIYSTALNEEDH